MRALLLAAGIGSRLRPITDTVPKCLVPIHGRPLLDYWLDILFKHGEVERVLINTHYLADRVRAHLASSQWRAKIDLVHEVELLGTGGTLRANRDYFGQEDFFVAHADNLTLFDLADFIATHRRRPRRCAMTMLAFRTDDPGSCGILELDNENVVVRFHEKVENPPGDLANAAVYLMTPQIADYVERFGKPFVDLSTEVLPSFMGRILAVATTGYHRDIGTVESLSRAHREFTPPQSER